MRTMIVLALCTGCTFGGESTFESSDNLGVRVGFEGLTLEDDAGSTHMDDLLFHNLADFLSEPQHLVLQFDHDEHFVEMDLVQLERLVAAGGRAMVHVDGVSQVVDVTTSSPPSDLNSLSRHRAVDLTFAFRTEAGTVNASMNLSTAFHCPPFLRDPATVDEAATLE